MDDAARLIDGLRRQREKYGEVAAVAERQRALLESNDLDGLLRLIERKRVLMEEIDAIKRETAGLTERWGEIRGRLPAGEIRAVEAVVEETRLLLEKILKIEEEDRKRIEQGHEGRGEELRKLHQQRKLRDAYGQKGEGETRFLDDKQ